MVLSVASLPSQCDKIFYNLEAATIRYKGSC